MEEVIYQEILDQPSSQNIQSTDSTQETGAVEPNQPPMLSNLIEIKQEISDNHIELENDAQILIEQDGGVQVSIDDFVNFHNEQVKNLKDEQLYLSRGFDIFYKFKTALDLIIEDYFKDDKHFKYRPIIESLEADLVTFIAEDEEKYQTLVNEINTEILLNADNQYEFVELDNPIDDDEEVVDGINEMGHSIIRKLPGQQPAPFPECPACGIKTRCRLKLEAHLTEHKDNPLVVCNHENCEITFELHNLSQHEKDYHPEVCLICEMCNEMFDNKTTLIQHYKLHITKKERLKCNFPGCDYTDIYTGRMDRHKKTMHNIEVTKQFRCEYPGCGRIFKDRPSYYTHSLIHKDRSLVYKHKCTYENCDAVFKRRRNLSLHMMKHGYVKRKYTCMFRDCQRIYSRERELMRHIELAHRGGLKPEPIDIEKYNEQPVEENLDVVETKRTKCEESAVEEEDCEEQKSQPIKKRVKRLKIEPENEEESSHEVSQIENEEDTPKKVYLLVNKGNNDSQQELEFLKTGEVYQETELIGTECELCQTNFETPEDLLNHLKDRHHQYSLKAYRCDFEDCAFITHFRSVLGRHKNDVHGGKYKCEICGKLSKDSGNHNRHRNIHKNIMYRCRVSGCDAVYKSPKAYYVHVLTHSNEQPVYACDHPGCKYVTYYMNTLNVHKLTHSDVRNFFCPYENCAKGFKRNGDLNKHIIHSHKGIKRPQKKKKNIDSKNRRINLNNIHNINIINENNIIHNDHDENENDTNDNTNDDESHDGKHLQIQCNYDVNTNASDTSGTDVSNVQVINNNNNNNKVEQDEQVITSPTVQY